MRNQDDDVMFLDSIIYQAPGKLVEFRANHLFPSESLPDKKIWEDVLMDRNLSTNLDIMMDSKVNHWVIDDLRSTNLNYAINIAWEDMGKLALRTTEIGHIPAGPINYTNIP